MTAAAALRNTSLDLAPEHPPKPMTLRDARRLARALWGERGEAFRCDNGACAVGVRMTPPSPAPHHFIERATWEEAFAAVPLAGVR